MSDVTITVVEQDVTVSRDGAEVTIDATPVEVTVAAGTSGPQGATGPSGGGSGSSGFSIGTVTPTASGEYLWVQTDGAGGFVDLIVGVN